MVLWEITLGTAYFLGLKRTYKLALKIQRRLITPKYPKTRQFVYRRIRSVFDVATRVHRNIQERDIEVGRNLGNWILRWLDRMKPSAQIRVTSENLPNPGNATTTMSKQLFNQKTNAASSSIQRSGGHVRGADREANRHLFTSPIHSLPKTFPTIAMMMRPPKPVGTSTPYRHISFYRPEVMRPSFASGGGLIRKDIMQWMVRN